MRRFQLPPISGSLDSRKLRGPTLRRFSGAAETCSCLVGRPFTRSVYGEAKGWHLSDYSVRFARALMIDQYQSTLGSKELTFQANPDLPVEVPRFDWREVSVPSFG
jgi:hypothetical protein